jgi:hypothetical protein
MEFPAHSSGVFGLSPYDLRLKRISYFHLSFSLPYPCYLHVAESIRPEQAPAEVFELARLKMIGGRPVPAA